MDNVTRICAAAAIAVWLSGCSAIYVGNIKFTSTEICSEEYASRLHPHSGCLPPTRAQNAQGLFLARFRLPVSQCEACNLTNDCPETKVAGVLRCSQPEQKPKPEQQPKNLLPSLVGRIFKAVQDNGDESDWEAPASGNIEFIAVGPVDKPPHMAIPTEILVKTDISGVVQKKLTVGADLNAGVLVDSALTAAGIPVAAAAKLGLKKALENQVLNANFGRSGLDAAKGAYYYVSIGPGELDRLMSAFTLCNWYVVQEPGHQKTTDTRASSATQAPGAGGTGVAEAKKPPLPVKDCAEILKNAPSISDETRNLISAIQVTRDGRPDLRVVGLVIGAAIAQTVKGQSELCTSTELGLIRKGDKEENKNKLTPSCDSLRVLVEKFKNSEEIKPVSTPDSPRTSPSVAAEDQANTLLTSLSAAYARASFKALDIESHTSVLAIHWVPVRIAK
jgi:hypothetical protein